MPFKGDLKRQTPFTIDLVGSTNDRAAVTVMKVNRREKVANADPTTIPLGTALTLNENLAAGVDRLLLFVTPPAGGQVKVTINQGGTQFSDMCLVDTILVFDAVP